MKMHPNHLTSAFARLIFFCTALLLLAAPSARAASLLGESVIIEVRFQGSGDSGSFDQLLTTTTATVGAGVELPSTAVSFTFNSGGFPQTLSGNVSADVSGTGMTVTFSGTQQPGGIVFVLKSVADQTVAA